METITRMLISKKTRTGVTSTDYNTPSDQDKIMLTNKNNNEQNQECCSYF